MRPTPTVGVICFRGEEVLLIKRGKPPRHGDWSIPGGRLEWNEAVKACALRELLEETGVKAELLGLVDVIDGFFGDERHYVLIDYAARWLEGEPQAGDDAVEAQFVPVAEAIERVEWPKTKQVIRDAWERFGAGAG
ncbi:MAG: NUDIX hydrolase [Caulobacteraceae bacterium]